MPQEQILQKSSQRQPLRLRPKRRQETNPNQPLMPKHPPHQPLRPPQRLPIWLLPLRTIEPQPGLDQRQHPQQPKPRPKPLPRTLSSPLSQWLLQLLWPLQQP